MICPYVQNSHIQIQDNIRSQEYVDLVDKYITIDYWGNMQCKKEECGAWHDGRCEYNVK